MAISAPVTQADEASRLYEKFVNPQWVKLLDVLQMNVQYARCVGCELVTTDGRRMLDFNSGYCVHNAGHNHPKIKAALRAELEEAGLVLGEDTACRPEPAGHRRPHLRRRAHQGSDELVQCDSVSMSLIS